MELSTIAAVIAGAGGLGVLVWVLAKLGRALLAIAEALVAAAAVFFALWLVVKAVVWTLRQTLRHWRTRPLAMRRIDTATGRVEVVPVPCGSTRADQCQPCAEKARRLRMAQCREGWHLDTEPATTRSTPSEEQQELMAARADFVAAYTQCKADGDEITCEQIVESVAELDSELRALGVRGHLTPLDPPLKPVKRSTRRRHDAPDLPRRPIERRTLGRVFAGRYRPSTFLTLTLDSYGRVDTHGAAIDPEHYDYRRAARDAIHFPALVDRFWQNTRRYVGWDVQYFGTVEPQKRGAPHFHAALRGTILRAELRAIEASTWIRCDAVIAALGVLGDYGTQGSVPSHPVLQGRFC